MYQEKNELFLFQQEDKPNYQIFSNSITVCQKTLSLQLNKKKKSELY